MSHTNSTVETTRNVTPPTAFDHEQAEMRGIYLCEGCGKELRYPANPQLCGRCEEATNEDA